METKHRISLPLMLVALLASPSLLADAREQAHRIHNRLTGLAPTNAVLDAMEAQLGIDPSGKSAADYALDRTQNPNAYGFYSITLKNFATPWTNEEQTVFAPLNDYSATVIGAVRDGLDFRRILYDDLLYIGAGGGLPAYSNSNNDHYEQLEARDPSTTGDLSSPGVLTQTTQSSVRPGVAPAGIMTSRAGAMAFYSDGTNRAMLRFTLMNHLCTDLEPLKDGSRTPDRVRRDVSRSPGGDSRIFLNNCVGCHAGMDGMAGAFAFYEWNYTTDKTDGNLVHTPGVVSAKHNINPNNFEYGYVTIDDSWVNYWRNGPNSILGNRPGDSGIGWRHPAGGSPAPGNSEIGTDGKGNSLGFGARSLGIELANSRAFAQCQVDKVFKAVCLRDPNVFAADRGERDTVRDNFMGAYGYDLREVFTDVAAYCKGS